MESKKEECAGLRTQTECELGAACVALMATENLTSEGIALLRTLCQSVGLVYCCSAAKVDRVGAFVRSTSPSERSELAASPKGRRLEVRGEGGLGGKSWAELTLATNPASLLVQWGRR